LQAASFSFPKSYGASAKGFGGMSLTQKASFKTVLQRGNRVQVPKRGQVAVQNGHKTSSKSRRARCQCVERQTNLLRKNGQRPIHNLPKHQRELLPGQKTKPNKLRHGSNP